MAALLCAHPAPDQRAAQQQGGDPGRWIPDNARALIRYAKSLPNGQVFDTWELGNEVNILFNAFHMPILLTWLPYASDLTTFRAVVDEEAPGCRIASPGCFFVPYASLRI